MVSNITLRLPAPLLFLLIPICFLQAQPAWERDLSFNGNGTLRIGGGREQESLRSMAFLPDGRILTAGRYGGDLSFIVARFQSDGKPDLSFGTDGKFFIDMGTHPGEARNILSLQNGRFILGATTENAVGQTVFGLFGFTFDGQPDPDFGIGGIARSGVLPDLNYKLNAIARQPDDKILAAGGINLYDGDESQQGVALCRFTPDGDMDNSFGINGVTRLTYPGERLEFNAIAQQPDGSIVAAGSNMDKIIVARFLSNGMIDSTFGFNGVKFLQYSAAGKTRCNAVSVLPGGKIILGAWCWEYWLNNGAIAIRLLPDGSLDPGFHNAGMSFIHCNYQLNTSSMVILPNGKIVLAAAGLNDDSAPQSAIFRYKADGAPDSTFAQNGAWVSPLGASNSALFTVAAGFNGKILAGGVAKKYLDDDFALVRLLDNGTLDPTFGEAGLVCADFNWGYDRAVSIHSHSVGRVLLASNASASPGNLFMQEKCTLDRLLVDGSPDYTFGNAGRDSFPGGIIKSVTFQPDGSILVATDGFWNGYQNPAALFRRLPDGGTDSTFGKAGCVDSLFGHLNTPVALGTGVLPDGRIVAAGSVNRPGTSRDFALTCLKPDGSRDSTFGNNGFVLVDFSNKIDEVYGMRVQTDGKILLAGTGWKNGITKKDIVVMRFLPDGVPDNTWGQNGILFSDFEAQVGENITEMAIESGGKLLIAVQRQLNADASVAGAFDNVLARYNANGTPDMTFGAGGRVYLPASGPDGSSRYIRQISFLASGKFLTAESLPTVTMHPDSFAVGIKRYLPNGAADTLAEAQSVISDRYGKVFRGFAIRMVPSEGVIWLAGSCLFDYQLNEDVILARYFTEPGCLPLSVRSVNGKFLADAQVSILPTTQSFSCMASMLTTACAEEILCLCGKDTTFIVPIKNDNPLNGVSTFDLVLISKHILGLEPLNSPYKIIAADVNQSKSVTTFDIVEIRKLILGIYQSFPNSASWRFVRENYVFPNPANPFAKPFPERDTVFVFETAERSAFVAVKTGDVNHTHVSGCNNFSEPEPRQTLVLEAAVCVAGKGDVISIPVSFSENTVCAAWQTALKFDPEALELLSAEPGALPGMDDDHFGLAQASRGELRVLWYAEDGSETKIEAGKTLFRLVFRAKREIGAGENILTSDDRALTSRAFRSDGEALKVDCHIAVQACGGPVATKVLAQPNPVGSTVCFSAVNGDLPKGECFVFKADGALAGQQSVTTGNREICFSALAEWPSGLYFWRLTGERGETFEGKFLKE